MSVAVELRAGERSDHAVACVLRVQLEAMREHHGGAISGEDPEDLHDLRVAVRRTRAVQRQLKPVFPAKRLKQLRGEFRWIQRATGEARDLDVYVIGFDALRDLVAAPMRPALEPVLEALSHQRLTAHVQTRGALRSERCRSLLESWDGLLDELEAGEGRRGAVPIGKLTDKRISKMYKRVVRMGSVLEREDFHALRKQGKELRYLLELFGSELHSPDVVKPMIKSLKSLQNALGRHQDRQVQVTMLGSLRDAVGSRKIGPAADSALDALIEQLREDQLAARADFQERFRGFAAKSQRKAFSHTFG